MNNEMISVPRELLERALQDALVLCFSTDPHVMALRALLAEPACKTCNDRGWVDNLRPVGTPAQDCQMCKTSAARPQGEPVYMVRTHGSCCWEEVGSGSLEDFKSMPEEYELRDLYTHADPGEFERLRAELETSRNSLMQDEARSIACGCLDEVAHLNGVK